MTIPRKNDPIVLLLPCLVPDSSGFPRRSHVYTGNVSEPTILSEMFRDLEGNHVSTKLKPTVVMDAGIATEENIFLKERQYPYLVVSRKRYREFDEESSVVVKKDDESTVRVQKVFNEEAQEVFLFAVELFGKRHFTLAHGRVFGIVCHSTRFLHFSSLGPNRTCNSKGAIRIQSKRIPGFDATKQSLSPGSIQASITQTLFVE